MPRFRVAQRRMDRRRDLPGTGAEEDGEEERQELGQTVQEVFGGRSEVLAEAGV